jgi:hypothetical protein
MSRKLIAALLLLALTCLACGGREAKEAESKNREHEFQKKRVCAELGRQRLVLDSREEEEEEISYAVRAEWCYSTTLNTCIYSNTHDVVFTPRDRNQMATIVMSTQATIDLLTNRTLFSADRTKSSRAELEQYEKKRHDLFSKCQ